MRDPLVVIGAGGFGRETLDVAEAAIAAGLPLELRGVVDDGPSALDLERLADRGIAFLGDSDSVLASGENWQFVVAIGDAGARRRIAERWEGAGHRPAVLRHPSSGAGARTEIGDGAVICAGAQLSTNVRLGRHAHVNPNATIGHDANVGAFASINPGGIISGNVVIEEDVLIGAGAVVLQGLRVGRGAIVGAAACVTKDVPAGATVKGVPAR